MSKGFDLATPLIIINMGGEMLYILDQRLKAQEVSPDKSNKVLNDVAKSLFSDDFLPKLFESQKTCSIKFTKQLFEKVVHCSIMKLNETSMGKLFDLMTMGLKYQMIASKSPHDIFFITLNHLEGILNIVKEGPALKQISQVKEKFLKKYSGLAIYEYLFMRQEIFKFLQDKLIRVSVFLQENLQNNDGSIVIPTKGIGGVFVKRPGLLNSYSKLGVNQVILEIKSAKDFIENNCKAFYDNKYVDLGLNLYDLNRIKSTETSLKAQSSIKETTVGSLKKNSTEKSDDDIQKELNVEAAKKELNSIFQSVKGKDSKERSNNFKLNLFPERPVSKLPANKQEELTDDIIFIDCGQSNSKGIKTEVEKMFENLEQVKNEADQENDLLDLMDSLNQ